MSTVKLALINDFITPAPLCIKPLIDAKQQAAAVAAAAANAKTGGGGGVAIGVASDTKAAAGATTDAPKKANAGAVRLVELELDADMKQQLSALEATAAFSVAPTASASSASGASAAASFGHFNQMRLDAVKKTATVSLNDCLACSGCVTSAETVLITAQSSDEFLNKLTLIRNQTTATAATAAPATATATTAAAASMELDSTARPTRMSVDGAAPTASSSSSSAAAATSSTPASASATDAAAAAALAPAAAPTPRVCVMTLSPHSRTALAAYFAPGRGDLYAAKRLTTLLHGMGVTALYDASVGLDIALLEQRHEFVTKFKAATAAAELRAKAAAAGAAPTTAAAGEAAGASASTAPVLPLLTGECPGWVCYAEKKEGKFALPYISTTKSPQQIMGSLVKRYLTPKLLAAATPITTANATAPAAATTATTDTASANPALVYHVSVMPCYDKKLEGSRDDFFDAAHGTRDVDCVLTTEELRVILVQVLRSNTAAAAAAGASTTSMSDGKADAGVASDVISLFAALPESPLDALSNVSSDGQSLYQPTLSGGAAGGYLEHIYRYSARELFGVSLDPAQPLRFTATRNPDMREIDLKVGGRVVLSFAFAYGFRNIPSLLARMKSGACKYHFVEVMACPSGCLNGGGQITSTAHTQPAATDADAAPAPPTATASAVPTLTPKQYVAALGTQYHQRAVRDPTDSALVQAVYRDWFGGASVGAGSAAVRDALHTSYHAIQSLEELNPLMAKW